MSVFKDYSAYYNLLYADKDYGGEAHYVLDLIEEYLPDANSILDIGCGTGMHAALMAHAGYHVHGVDFSEDMIRVAKGQIKNGSSERLSFSVGDARSFELGKKYDVVVALFHVLSYLNENTDIEQFFTRVQEHLKEGGLFIFDFWYGPAVLSERPEKRVKEMEDHKLKITRHATPEMHPERNVVDVNYKVLVDDKRSKETHEVNEKHSMRYFFQPELNTFLEKMQFEPLHFFEWMTDKSPSENTWSVVTVCRKS